MSVSPVQAGRDFQGAEGARTFRKHHLVASALGLEKPSGWEYAGSMVQSWGKNTSQQG